MPGCSSPAAVDPSLAERVAAANEELEAERLAWAHDFDDDDVFSFVRMLGGQWTALHKGVAADGVGGFACAGAAAEWCALCAFPCQMSFMYRKWTKDVAHQFAWEYVWRAQYFFMLWLHSDDDAFGYRAVDVASYVECAEWADSVHGLAAGTAAAQRAAEIRATCPPLG